MATLQKTIQYTGTGALPVPVRVELSIPFFEYKSIPTEPTSEPTSESTDIPDKFLQRSIVRHTLREFLAEGSEYAIFIPDSDFSDPLEAEARLRYISSFVLESYPWVHINIEDISYAIDVKYYVESTFLGTQQLQVIELVRQFQREGTYPMPTILLNRDVYARLADTMNLGALSRFLMLAIGFSISQTAPADGFNISDNLFFDRNLFFTNLENFLRSTYLNIEQSVRKTYLEQIPGIINRIRSSFDLAQLFDFPLTIPEVESAVTVDIGGTFTITTDQPESVTGSNLAFYDLSVEYNNGVSARTLHYDWDLSLPAIGNTPVDFALPIQDIVRGNFFLSVKIPDGTVVWQKEYSAEEDNIDQIHIQVPLMRPNTIGGGSNPGAGPVASKKLRGQVVQLEKHYDLNGLTVLIQTKKADEEIWQIAGAARTDANGNFSLPYPYGNFAKAQALVSATPNSPAPVNINPDSANESISDDFLYLLLEGEPAVEVPHPDHPDPECGCNGALVRARRLPDQQDLIESDEFTQDVGGSCMNLTTPNRTLREYGYQAVVRVTDPDVANYTLEKTTDYRGNTQYRLRGENRTIHRGRVSLENPIRWQDAPDAESNLTFYQAVTVATGHILHYKSIFKADGYSLGELLYSLPLAPGQKKQIVIFDSSHTLTGAESQTVSQGERLAANLTNERSITDQLGGGISEALSGSSTASTSGISAGLGAGGSMGPISAVLGVSGGYANSNSSASQNSSRDISQFFSERLRQSIMQNAESYRQLNASVVTTVREGQQYGVTTEAVANHNHCHALTMMYFEVLRHYAIYQELSHVEECVFVPLLMTNFTPQNISKWKDVLATHLLPVPSSTYLTANHFNLRQSRHPLLNGFDALERIRTNYELVEFPNARFADEQITEITGSISIRVHIPRPKTRFDRILSFPVIKKTITSQGDVDVAGTIRDNIMDSVVGAVVPCAAQGPSIRRDTVTTEVLTRAAIFDMFMTLDANYESVPPAQCIRVNFDNVDVFDSPMTLLFQGQLTGTPMDFFAGMEKEKALWSAYAAILGIPLRELFGYFNNNLIADWDRIFNEHIAPKIVDKLIRETTLSLNPISVADITPIGKYQGGERVIRCPIQGTVSLTRAAMETLTVQFRSPIAGTLHDEFFGFVTFQLESIALNYATNFSTGRLLHRNFQNDLRDSVPPIPTPLTSEEKRNPRNEDRLMARQLLEHLNSNLEHYNKALWFNLDTDRRYMLLDGFNIQVFNEFGNPVGYRSLASVVKNQLVTITGNSMVLPVSAGYKVSMSYIVEREETGIEADPAAGTLLQHYKPLTPIPPYRISVPTKGVFLEAIQGACDACEKVKPNSSQDWTVFTTEEPTAIQPVVTPTPVVTDWKAAFKEFAQPLVNIQNAPATPAPGAGLTGLSELLGKAGVFNDITGLQGNQENAIRTYLSNQENVRALAEMAKTMAMQEHNTRNSDVITSSLDEARESGAISAEDHGRLTTRHLEQQIDGGEGAREAARVERERERPSLADAAIEAAGDGRRVTAQRTDADGNVETVNISEDSTASDSASLDVVYDVPLIPQPTENSCWAAAMAMMVAFRQQISITPEAIVEESRQESISLDDAYNFESLQAVRDYYGFRTIELPSNASLYFSPEQWRTWLSDHGPLWITTTGAPAHAVVMRGIRGNMTPDNTDIEINDPEPVGVGEQTTLTFSELAALFGRLGLSNYGNTRILYLPDPNEGLSGGGTEVDGDGNTVPGSRTQSINVRNKFINNSSSWGLVSDCLVEILSPDESTVHATQTSNRFGRVTLDLDSLADGSYKIRISPDSDMANTVENIITLPVSDSTLKTFETFPVSNITIRSHRIVASENPDIQMDSGHLTVLLTPMWLRSPNVGVVPAGVTRTMDYIVLHHTGDNNIGSGLNTFLVDAASRLREDPDSEARAVSPHYAISSEGKIVKLVADSQIANHAGQSYWNGRFRLNPSSIGIEIANANGSTYPEAQMLALIELLEALTDEYDIDRTHVIGHSDIATTDLSARPSATSPGIMIHPTRRMGDPGRLFDWPRLEALGFSLQQRRNSDPLVIYDQFFATFAGTSLRTLDTDATKRYGGRVRADFASNTVIQQIQEDLLSIGYLVNTDGVFNEKTANAVKAFQIRIFSGSRQSELTSGISRVDAVTAKYIRDYANRV